MKQSFLKPILLCLNSSLVASSLITPFIVSCSSGEDGDVTIQLTTPTNYLMPGDSFKIEVEITNKDSLDDASLEWVIDNTVGHMVWLSKDGTISASSLMNVDGPARINVYCWLKKYPDIKSSITLFASPLTPSNFLGFENNEIRCLKRNREVDPEPKIVKIIKDNDNVYKNETNIDLFINDVHPVDWSSFIDFTPVFKRGSRQEMYFRTAQDDEPSIVWSAGYLDGAPTLSIPDFYIQNFKNIFAYIDVTFKADSNIKLHLTFNLWNARKSDSGVGEFTYVQGYDDDPHRITSTSTAGDYDATVFCPTEKRDGTFEGDLDNIYIYKHQFEFLDFEFVKLEDEKTKSLINNAFSFSFSNPIFYQRPIDHFPYYKISMHYSFDLTKMPLAKDLEYKSLRLVTLTLHDPLSATSDNGHCRFNIEWF